MGKTEIVALAVVGILIFMDYLTGLCKAAKQHDISSEKMREGLWHKGSFIIVLALAEVIERAQDYIDMGYAVPILIPTAIYIAVTEVSSILENAGEINPELAESPVMRLFRSSKHGDGAQ